MSKHIVTRLHKTSLGESINTKGLLKTAVSRPTVSVSLNVVLYIDLFLSLVPYPCFVDIIVCVWR
ncbi:hypothetical protein RHMOL_Rhmol02G0139500 [Rhododendron molle]|uniref:Uncharacterized protein n=1 Tax=Rhododendron molle TaxID=49168 RepID=A0ACC0PPL3_RHOML|nr:hypothetical protein RHMOL_Rhmol02G0139500 [Rhododendron molle]